MRFLASIAFLLLTSIAASAQWNDEWYSYVPPCEHKGTQTLWQIVKYRASLAAYDKTEPAKGTVRMSDSCIEIDCYQLVFTFDVRRYEKVTSAITRVYKNTADELYDYMEIKQGIGNMRDFYMIFIGKRDDNGKMHNTTILTCKPYVRAK